MRMRELERLSGVGRETIRFYLKEGLLPEPERTGRNSAWYDARFLSRLRLIRELREKRFLPLQVIKAIVADDTPPPRDEVRTLLELDGRLFPAVDGAPPAEPERLGAVAKRTGLPAAEIRAMAEQGAFAIDVQGGREWLDETGQRICELWGRIRRAGFTDALGFGPRRLRMYVDMVRWLARQELQMFAQGVSGKVSTERAVRMAEDGITLMNPIIGLLRRSALLEYIAQGNMPDSDTAAVDRPRRARRGKRA
jgi:DNA-binding transcriptional MerR regulator